MIHTKMIFTSVTFRATVVALCMVYVIESRAMAQVSPEAKRTREGMMAYRRSFAFARSLVKEVKESRLVDIKFNGDGDQLDVNIQVQAFIIQKNPTNNQLVEVFYEYT